MTVTSEIDLLAIGETIVDLISTEPVAGLGKATTFRRYLGGAPANIAVNMAKLGARTAVVSKVGLGPLGRFLKEELEAYGVNTDYLIMDRQVHTTFIFVSQTADTPEFEPVRDADYKLSPTEISEEAIARAKIIHASTWPLSREPARSAVRRVFQLAHEQGKLISLDPNYSPIVWPDSREARQVLREIYRYVTIIKASLDDSVRFFGPVARPEQYLEMLHELGPQTVVLTMGKEGSLLSQNGHMLGCLPARPVKVVDATGAGDAFWAGFLVAMLDGHPVEKCLLFAREIAEIKLSTIGPLAADINRLEIYNRLWSDSSTLIKPI